MIKTKDKINIWKHLYSGTMVSPTIDSWTENLLKIRGVKSVSIKSTETGQVLINVHYNLWTYLWFGLNKKVSKKVNDFVYAYKPCGVSCEVRK